MDLRASQGQHIMHIMHFTLRHLEHKKYSRIDAMSSFVMYLVLTEK